MNKKKVCFLTQEYKKGATWIYCFQLAKILNEEGDWEAHIISAAKDCESANGKIEVPFLSLIETSSSRYFYSRNYWKKSKEIVKKLNPDVVQGNMNLLSSLGIKNKYPIVETVHTTFSREKRGADKLPLKQLSWVERRVRLLFPLLKFVEKRVLKRASHLIAVSEAIKEELVEYYSIEEEKITVIPNGVDTRIHCKTDEKIYNKKEKEFVLGFLGRMTAGKGAHLILPIIKKIKEEIPDVKLLIAGDDLNSRKKILSQIDKLELNENIIDFGYIYDNHKKNTFFSSVDLFLLPSSHEGMSLVLLEAMACQTPILTTPEAETFNHDDTLIISPRSIADFALKAIEFRNNPKTAEKIREKSREVAEQLSWQKTTEQTKEVFERLRI
ncbi:MAG: glycosyltransferase family 4 protein [Candidatus Heimdallarchaeota archaeon]|nr:glycosyltransferase family 4 protein [Candidatus Heimdallarchaeota archaeon]MCG3255045.1 glycosyltransferase family 4 protein [Candidatus Heimdallarchaeota archaeon]MCK4610119.1 glycosyltransferase family 4 protein [Candidatus Heimdallarchaeota archaeon]